VIVDGLGVGALNCWTMLRGDPAIYDATLRHRKYDLVILNIGSNTFFPEQVPPCLRKLIARHKAALPDVPFLIMTPPDFLDYHDPPRSSAWMVKICPLYRAAAIEGSCPFFDFHEAMGGEASMARFQREKMTVGDWIHFNEKGGAYMGDRVVRAIWTAFV